MIEIPETESVGLEMTMVDGKAYLNIEDLLLYLSVQHAAWYSLYQLLNEGYQLWLIEKAEGG